jgi:hypothetical protein
VANFVIDPEAISNSELRKNIEEFIASSPDAAKWEGFFASLAGQLLIDKDAAVAAFLSYRSIVARRENYLQHAQNRSSGIGISQSLGYSVFRGQNQHLTLNVTPEQTTSLSRFDIIGSIKDQDLVLLEDVALVTGQTTTVSVAVGLLQEDSITIDTTDAKVFTFSGTGVTEDVQLLLNDVEQEYSDRIVDLDDDKWVALSNVFGSVDVQYLNRDTAAVNYINGDILKIKFVQEKLLTYANSDVNFFYGSLNGFSVDSQYTQPEQIDTTRVNAPLFHETQALVRARKDFLKLFKTLDPTFVSTNQQDVTSAIVELVYLREDHSALTTSEKEDLLLEINDKLAMGVPPPLMADPVRVPLALSIAVSLSGTGSLTTDIEDILAAREDILGFELDLEDLEADIEALTYVKIARISLGSDTWADSTHYEIGQRVDSALPTGFHYSAARIIYKSGLLEPTWPTVLEATVEDGDLVWNTELVDLSQTPISAWSSQTDYIVGDIILPVVPNGYQYKVASHINRSFGEDEIQTIDFDVIPDAGNWYLVYTDAECGAKRTTELAYNAAALDVQNALNDLECLSEVIVTGNYSIGFTVHFQGADGNKPHNQLEVTAVGYDEQQLISYDQVPNSGSFGLDFDGQVTIPIPFSALTTDFKAALEGLPNVDEVEVSGDFTNGHLITFKGVNAKTPVVQLVQALLASSGTDEVQEVTFSTTPDGGFFIIHAGSEYTSHIPFGASTTTVQGELNALTQFSGITVASIPSGYEITFSDDDGKKPQVLLDVNHPGQNERQLIQFSSLPDFGTYRLDYLGEKTDFLNYDATPAEVAGELNDLSSLSGVSGSGDYANGILLEFDGSDGLKEHDIILVESGVNETQRLDFTSGATGGTFSLNFDGQITDELPFDTTATSLTEAMEALSNVDQVSVGGDMIDGFDIEYQGVNSNTDLTEITINSNSLTEDTVAEEVEIQTVADVAESLDGKTFLLYDDDGSVAFWIDVNNSGTPEPVAAVGAGRSVRISTILPNDSANDVAIKVRAAIHNDLKFTATSVGDTIDIIYLDSGDKPDAVDVDSGFTVTVLTQGTTIPVTPSASTTIIGVEADNNLTRTGNTVEMTVSVAQEGISPANSLTDGGSPITAGVAVTVPGEEPVSNLERSSVPIDVVITTPVEGEYPANNLSSGGGPVVVTVDTLIDSSAAEPTWPTTIGERIFDGDIIWTMVAKNGTPDNWEPAKQYLVGEFASPTTVVEDGNSQELMIQCVGYIGKSGTSEPSFEQELGGLTEDGNLEWETVSTTSNPEALGFDEYYDISEEVTSS